MIRIALMTLVLSSGEDGGGQPRDELRALQLAASAATGCVDADLEDVHDYGGSSKKRFVNQCGKHLSCEPIDGTLVCMSLDQAMARAEQENVRKRLALETGCALSSISIQQHEGEAFRLLACRKPYICTSRGTMIECKAAPKP